MQIKYHKTFKKQYKKLRPNIQDKFDSRLLLFTENKYHKLLSNHPVDAAYPNCRSINITGDYRALYIEQGEVIVFVMIGTHSELY
jgi:addiction module RelE/StbE family toxin